MAEPIDLVSVGLDGVGAARADLREASEADRPTGQVPIVVAASSPDAAREQSLWAPSTNVASIQAPVVGETRVVIDAEEFARVFGTTIASVMRELEPSSQQAAAQYSAQYPAQYPGLQQGALPYAAPQFVPLPMAASPAMSGGFWASARHLDVLLLGFTTVIVMVVLGAWLA